MQLGQTVRGLQDQGNINRLAGQAANSSGMERTSALNQMWGINPQMAAQHETALGASEDRRNKGMVQAARMLSGAPESMRPGLYQQMKPMLSQYGLQLPEQYDNTVAEAANALVQAYGGAAGASGVQSTYIDADGNRVAIMRDGSTSILGKNDLGATKQTVTMDINGVPTQVTFDRRTAGYEQATLGGSPQQVQPQQTGTRFTAPNGEVIDVSQIQDPHVRQQIINDPQSWGMVPDGSSAALPQRDVASMPTPIVGRPKEAEAAEVERARLNAQLNALPAELGMRTQAAINQAVGIDEGKAQAERARDAEQKLTRVTNDASNMLAMIERVKNSPGREIVTGLSGTLDPRAYLPGGAAADFRANLQQLQGSAFLQAFESLKGGGAITEIEGKKAEQAIAALQTDQSDEGFMRSIATLEQVIRDGVAKAQRDASRLGRGQQSPQPKQQGAVRIQNSEDYSRLPSGALYITPTGETRRKR